jgi:CheY-like chemotaxis protein
MLNVLYLEDDRDDVELVRTELCNARLDCEVMHVDSEVSLASALERRRFDAILVDYVLPRFDGLRAMQIARSLQPGTPVILLTGAVEDETASQIARIGADAYVLKARLHDLAPTILRLASRSPGS